MLKIRYRHKKNKIYFMGHCKYCNKFCHKIDDGYILKTKHERQGILLIGFNFLQI